MKNTLEIFTKGRYNLNLLLGNQRASYNKVDLGYEPTNNVKNFDKICYDHKTPKCKTLKCKYCNKNVHMILFYFIKKSHVSKYGHPPSIFFIESIMIIKWKTWILPISAIMNLMKNPMKVLFKLRLKDPK